MLILLTLSLLPAGDRNITSDFVARAVNMGGELKKSFHILLNDTEAMERASLDLKNEKMLSNKPDKMFLKQLAQRLSERFSTPPNIKVTKTPGNIPQGDDGFYNTPGVIDPLSIVPQKHKTRSARSDTLKTTAPAAPVDILDGKNAYYNTPPQARVVKHPRIFQKHNKELSKLDMIPKDLETTPNSNVYYNTPSVVLGVDSNAILKKQYGIEKHITQRKKVPRYILRRHRNIRNNTHKGRVSHRPGITKQILLLNQQNVTDTTLSSVDTPQGTEMFYNRAQKGKGHRSNRTLSKKHIRTSPIVTENAISIVNVLQINESTVNISDKIAVSKKSGSRKRFHKPLREVSTFEPINILQGDETLLDVPQPVNATYDEKEESSENEFSAPPNILRSSSLAPGDVLYGIVLTEQSTKEPQLEAYYKKMKENNIGYLSVAFEDLCEHLAAKKQEHVAEIVKHTQFIVHELQVAGRLRWLGEPMSTILRDLAIRLATDSADVLQVRAMIVKSLMQQRRKLVGTDVNEILDYADDLILKEDGEHLVTVMQEVKRYPDVSKNGRELCTDIIEAFETPFLQLSGTKDLEHMVKRANKAFADRFQQYSDFREAKNHPAGASSPSGLKPSLQQRMPQNIIHSPKVPSVSKSRNTTQAIKHPSKNKPPSIDKHPLKDVHQSINKNPLKGKRHTKHKHFSKHKHPTKETDKDPSEKGEEGHVSKDKSLLKHKHKRTTKEMKAPKIKHSNTRKRYSEDATVLRRGQTYLKPGMLMGKK